MHTHIWHTGIYMDSKSVCVCLCLCCKWETVDDQLINQTVSHSMFEMRKVQMSKVLRKWRMSKMTIGSFEIEWQWSLPLIKIDTNCLRSKTFREKQKWHQLNAIKALEQYSKSTFDAMAPVSAGHCPYVSFSDIIWAEQNF